MSIIGNESTSPLIFYSGKITGYILWILYILSFFDVINIQMLDIVWLKYISSLTAVIGFFFTIISLINLGKSTRLGLPNEDTVFKDVGLYKISRNPMYVGFNLFTISSILLTANMITLFAGLFSIYSYHLIIKGEEIFLEHRFGQKYLNYKQKVRRYF